MTMTTTTTTTTTTPNRFPCLSPSLPTGAAAAAAEPEPRIRAQDVMDEAAAALRHAAASAHPVNQFWYVKVAEELGQARFQLRQEIEAEEAP